MTTLALQARSARSIMNRLAEQLAPIDAEIARLAATRESTIGDALADLRWIDAPVVHAFPHDREIRPGTLVHLIEQVETERGDLTTKATHRTAHSASSCPRVLCDPTKVGVARGNGSRVFHIATTYRGEWMAVARDERGDIICVEVGADE